LAALGYYSAYSLFHIPPYDLPIYVVITGQTIVEELGLAVSKTAVSVDDSPNRMGRYSFDLHATSDLLNNKMRILHIIGDLRPGGAEILLRTVSTVMSARPDVDFRVCSLRSKRAIGTEIESLGVPVYALERNVSLHNPLIASDLLKLLQQFRPQVVHTHLYAANYYGRIAAYWAKVPVIVATEHNQYVSKRFYHVLIDRCLARTGVVVTPSRFVADFTAQQERIPLAKFNVICNAVDASFFQMTKSAQALQTECEKLRSEIRLKKADFVIGNVSRLAPQKGQLNLIDAMPRILEQIPNAKLIIVGHGPLEDLLRDRIKALKLESEIYLLGHRSDIKKLHCTMDAFAFPTYREGQPIALMEAMASGLPVVATSLECIEEFVTHDQNGLLVAPGDVNGLAKNLIAIARNASLRHSLATAARDSSKLFSPESHVEKLLSLYTSLLNDGRGRQG